jgi:acyl-coenzyme A thioesterase PaaI-like protein
MSAEPNIVDGHGAATPPESERAHLVDALRRVTDLVVRPGASREQLHEAAVAVEVAAATLAPVTEPWRASIPAHPDTTIQPHDFFPFSPMIGLYSPLAAPLRCEIHDQTVTGRVRLGAAYEGPPGCVHGGVIAGLFDELLGIANIAAGVGAMTGTLTIVYRSPTPLYTDLTLEAHTLSIEGRKIRTVGTLLAGDRLCAEAHGIFILVEHERFATHTREHGATTT